MGASTNRKSGPIWAMESELSLTSSRMFTWAEWPPLLDNAIMDEILYQHARDFASQHQLELRERLGFGIHGIVFLAESKLNAGKTAIKVHRSAEPYFRERAVYERLKSAEIWEILGFHVPQLLRVDDNLLIIELSVVSRPFVLDFAGAYLDKLPDFPDDQWEAWEVEKREQFENRWPEVRAVMGALEELDIHMVDVSPSNIAFLD